MLVNLRSMPLRQEELMSFIAPRSPATMEMQSLASRFSGSLKSKQDSFRGLHLHNFRSDVVARTHLGTKFGAPVCYIPFETVHRNF